MPWWDSDFATFIGQAVDHRVATWPLPGGVRVDGRFKMVNGVPPCASRASRHLVTWRPFALGTRYFALIDVAYDGVPGELFGTTGEDPHGRVMELRITDHQVGNPHPDYSEIGLNYLFTLKLPSHTDWHTEWFYPDLPGEGFTGAPVSLRETVGFGSPAREQNDDFGPTTAWQSFIASRVDWYTFTECREPDGQEMVFPPSFAEFNGEDSYISLTAAVGAMNNPFVLKADIRRRGFPWIWPIFGIEGQGGFHGMDLSQMIFGNLTLDTDWTEVDDVWFRWEYRFEQDTELHHQLFIDDVEVMDRTVARQFMNPNNLGVFRHNSFPEIWGHFDMKELLYLVGTPGSFEIRLNMPLTENALDLSDNENHGTTFNMDLPSV